MPLAYSHEVTERGNALQCCLTHINQYSFEVTDSVHIAVFMRNGQVMKLQTISHDDNLSADTIRQAASDMGCNYLFEYVASTGGGVALICLS